MAPVEVELLYFDECPNHHAVDAHLMALADDFPTMTVSHHLVDTPDEAERVGFRGSPTILVNGLDPFATEADPIGGLSCRVYQTPGGPAGSPTLEQLRAALSVAS